MARGKSWRLAEDLALVRAIAAALRDGQPPDRGVESFWQRVAAQYARLLADPQAPPRTWTAVESHWKRMRAELAPFVTAYEAVSRDGGDGGGGDGGEESRVAAALQLFRDNDPNHRTFEHVEFWKLLRREIPRHEDFVAMSTATYMAHKRRRSGSDAAGNARRRRVSDATHEAAELLVRGDGDDDDEADEGEGGDCSETSGEATVSTPADSGAQSEDQQPQQSVAAEAAEVARYRSAKLEAYETRNALLAEQNAIATERNMITLFATRDDAMAREFFELKRRLELAKLRQEVADAAAGH